MEDFFKLSKDRSFITNLILCLFSLCCIILVPLTLRLLLGKLIEESAYSTLLTNSISFIILFLIYYKDLVLEAKIFKNNFKENIKIAFKYYGIGLLCMIISNAILMILLKNISANETEVREMLHASPIISLISICILAPLTEELIFRKSARPLINNRWIYAIVCGLLFGLAHILINFMSGVFVITDLLYIIPYGSLGFAFALMDYDTNTTFSSIFIHAFHNTLTAIMLLTMLGGIK